MLLANGFTNRKLFLGDDERLQKLCSRLGFCTGGEREAATQEEINRTRPEPGLTPMTRPAISLGKMAECVTQTL